MRELRVFSQKYEGQKWTRENFERECLWNVNYFFTGDSMFGDKGLLVISYDAQSLRNLTPDTELDWGSLHFTGEIDGKIRIYSGEELKRLEKDGLLGNWLKEEQVTNGDYVHPVWAGIAHGRKEVIQEFAPLEFKALRDCYDLNEGMAIYTPSDRRERALVLSRTDSRASANDVNFLDVNDARLVGVREIGAQKSANLDRKVEQF